MASKRPTTLLLLVPAGLRPAVQEAAGAAGFAISAVDSLGRLLEDVRDRPWGATLISFSHEAVDEAVAERLAEQANTGPLLLSAPAVTLERAVIVEKAGAVALLREPIDAHDLAERLGALRDEGPGVPLPASPAASTTGDADVPPVIVGECAQMARTMEVIARVARSDATVLITGASGTGKEVVARALHWASDRRTGPFVAVNCAAIPETLLESELFGHEKGAFTGAVARRVGRFERAHGGTLFLDEIGDMSLVLQAKILRVLEERVVDRVGGDASSPIDVRVVAATNQSLREALDDGRFREDLFFRLAVVEMALPPLRERGDDIRGLALHFASEFARRHGRPVRAISERALARLAAAPWPGNVRELRNVMDRAVLLSHGEMIRASDLRLGNATPRGSARPSGEGSAGYAPTASLEEVESDHIRKVLAALDGHMGQAAEVLGIHRNTLTRKMKDYGLSGRVGR